MRINVRIDDRYEQKRRAIQRATDLNTTEIIKQALDLLYEKTALSGKEKNLKLLERLAGKAKGPKDLSVNYKEYLDQGWKEKHGIK